MTITEAHRLFRLSLDKMDGLNYPNFRPEEIDLILNEAQDRYVKQRYGHNNPKRTGLEEEQKRTEDLKNVIKNSIITPNTQGINNYDHYKSWFVTLPADHWFVINEKAIINAPNCNTTFTILNFNSDPGAARELIVTGRYVEIEPVRHMEISSIDSILKDPFRGPDNDKILRLMYPNSVELVLGSGATLLYYFLRYIKKPTRVSLSGNVTFELSDHTHSEIVMEAVKIALEGIEAKRVQTFTPIIDNTKE